MYSICFFVLGIWGCYDAWSTGLHQHMDEFIAGAVVGGAGLLFTVVCLVPKFEFTGTLKKYDSDLSDYYQYDYGYTGVAVKRTGKLLFKWNEIEKVICTPYEGSWGEMDLRLTIYFAGGGKAKITDEEVWHFAKCAKLYMPDLEEQCFYKAFEHYRNMNIEKTVRYYLLPFTLKPYVLYEKAVKASAQ